MFKLDRYFEYPLQNDFLLQKNKIYMFFLHNSPVWSQTFSTNHTFVSETKIFCTPPVSFKLFVQMFKKPSKWTRRLQLPADKSLIDQNLRHLMQFLQALKISRVKLGSSVSSLALKEIPNITYCKREFWLIWSDLIWLIVISRYLL